MERRRIIRQEKRYHVLKPNSEGWNEYGKKLKGIKGVHSFLEQSNGNYEIEISPEVEEDLTNYRKKENARRKRHNNSKNISSKVI